MLKKIKKINEKIDKHSEIFMLISFYFISIVLNWLAFSLINDIKIFPQNFINKIAGILIFLIVLLFSLNMLSKLILWIKLKPKISQETFEKAIKNNSKKDKEILKENTIEFENWMEFSIFSITVLATKYLPFFWTLKMVLASNPFRNKMKNEKIKRFYIGKSLFKKQETIHLGFLTKQLNKRKNK